jgi:Reverse transcriptase (RNA-dependent DNA polymerase)
VISPLLANLFLHYAFDQWMTRNHSAIPFERYADDVICHCTSEAEASALRVSLEERFTECGLTLHPEKTKIVYGARRIPIRSSTFSATRFGRDCRGGGGARLGSRSVRQPATKL